MGRFTRAMSLTFSRLYRLGGGGGTRTRKAKAERF